MIAEQFEIRVRSVLDRADGWLDPDSASLSLELAIQGMPRIIRIGLCNPLSLTSSLTELAADRIARFSLGINNFVRFTVNPPHHGVLGIGLERNPTDIGAFHASTPEGLRRLVAIAGQLPQHLSDLETDGEDNRATRHGPDPWNIGASVAEFLEESRFSDGTFLFDVRICYPRISLRVPTALYVRAVRGLVDDLRGHMGDPPEEAMIAPSLEAAQLLESLPTE